MAQLIELPEKEEPQEKKATGFALNPDGINKKGRPRMLRLPERTNREIRQSELISLVRKFKPLQTKAIQAAIKIIDSQDSNDSNKLRASALLIQTYRQLLLDTFDYRYDDEQSEEIQDKNVPIFSLKIINTEDQEEKVA